MKNTMPLLIAALLVFPVSLAAAGEGDYKLVVEDCEVPEEIAEPLRELIAPTVYKISGPDGELYDFWFAKEIQMESFSDVPHKLLDGVKHVSVIGAAIAYGDERNLDFREDPVDPGPYTMRMAVQPQDGDHMGTAPQNTFAVLIYADRDKTVDGFEDHEHMIDTSREDTIAEHPPVLYMQNDEAEATEYPRLDVSDKGIDEWNVLCLKLPADVNGEKKELAFQIVFHGLGEL